MNRVKYPPRKRQLISDFLLFGNPAKPDARRDEDKAAPGGKPDEKGDRQIKPGTN